MVERLYGLISSETTTKFSKESQSRILGNERNFDPVTSIDLFGLINRINHNSCKSMIA